MITPSAWYSIDAYAGAASPGTLLAGSPFTDTEVPYTGTDFYFHSLGTLTAQPITGLPSEYEMYTGGRVTWDPLPEGGVWDWDHEFFSATFNSPATFTALKAGTSIITYTVGGVSQSITVTIRESELPQTGQDYTWVWVLCGAAAILIAAAGVLILKRRRKPENIE